jgi:hypothetical protein
MEGEDSDGDRLGVELEGDQDLIVASRDFNKVASSRSKVRFIFVLSF